MKLLPLKRPRVTRHEEVGRLYLCATGFFVFSPSSRANVGRRFLLSGVTPKSSRHHSSEMYGCIIFKSLIRDITARENNARVRVVPQELGWDEDAGCWRCSCSPTLSYCGLRTTNKYFCAHIRVCVCVSALTSWLR